MRRTAGLGLRIVRPLSPEQQSHKSSNGRMQSAGVGFALGNDHAAFQPQENRRKSTMRHSIDLGGEAFHCGESPLTQDLVSNIFGASFDSDQYNSISRS